MFTSAADVATYALAGHAKLTLTSQRTGARYTFKINQAKNRETGEPVRRWFVSLLSGPDNEADYQYLGIIDERAGEAAGLDDGPRREFRLTAKSRYKCDSTPARAFAYFWRRVDAEQMPPEVEVRHEGTCGRCGRALTVPESIDRGIGPECSKMMEM